MLEMARCIFYIVNFAREVAIPKHYERTLAFQSNNFMQL